VSDFEHSSSKYGFLFYTEIENLTSVPSPSLLLSLILPPHFSTTNLQIVNPNPQPVLLNWFGSDPFLNMQKS